MRKMVLCILISVLFVTPQGCATLKNTKVPKAFKDVGVCGHCKKLIALDGLTDDETAVCPECGAPFTVRDARAGFKRSIAIEKNRKTARSFLTVTWLAASVAGMFYGIPIPPPIIDRETFSPYQVPFRISCRRARRADEVLLAGPENNGAYKNLYIPSRLPNPYETEMGPYSLVITDYEGAPLTKIGEGSCLLMKEPVVVEGKNRLLEIKN